MSTEKERTSDAFSTSRGLGDLTSKARIRNAALSLFAQDGQDGTSLRAIATEAHVTVGLVAHHYGTKEVLREAVDTFIVDLFADTLRAAPMSGTAREVVTLRDGAVAQMLAANPAIMDYLRRALLTGQGQTGDVVSRLAELTVEQVKTLRETGLASTERSVTEQTLTTFVRQFGRLLLQPLVDRIVDEFGEPDEHPPELIVIVKS